MDLSIRQAAYRSQLTALLPTGRAWATESDPALADFIAALALELARIEQRATELLAEATPYGAYETLPEWEATAGLPDECSAAAAGDIQARRMALVARRKARRFICTCCAYPGNHRRKSPSFTRPPAMMTAMPRCTPTMTAIVGRYRCAAAETTDRPTATMIATARCSCIKAALLSACSTGLNRRTLI